MSNLNVNNITPQSGSKVSVSGSLHVKDNITYGGNATFGDAATDTTTFIGHITASGNISSSNGTVTARSGSFRQGLLIGTPAIFGQPAQLSFKDSNTLTIENSAPLSFGINVKGSITASGNISSSGVVHGVSGSFKKGVDIEGIRISPYFGDSVKMGYANGQSIFKSLAVNNITSSGNIKATGNISSSNGTVTARSGSFNILTGESATFTRFNNLPTSSGGAVSNGLYTQTLKELHDAKFITTGSGLNAGVATASIMVLIKQ